MTGDDDELVMISALQHYLFCPRQCALIHVEGYWQENYLTASGRVLHAHVDQVGRETRRDVHVATSIRLISRCLGVMGVADKVEFHRVGQPDDAEGCTIAVPLVGQADFWRPYPVEYKHGKPKDHRADEVQLCAQAMCLEEMLHVFIPVGFLFYGETRRRVEVPLGQDLRDLTIAVAKSVRHLLDDGTMPSPIYGRHCESCSLKDVCCPERVSGRVSARRWIDNRLDELLAADGQCPNVASPCED